MRWKAILFAQQDNICEEKYDFKMRKCPSQHKDLIHFDMVKKIYLKKVSNSLQYLLRNDLSVIKRSAKAFTFADKTRNLYELDKQSYDIQKVLQKHIKKHTKLYITTSTSNQRHRLKPQYS